MLRFIRDTHGVMGLTLSQIGLFVATGILLAAVCSFIFLNSFPKKADLENIASGFSTIIEGMDTRFYENKTVFWFPDKSYEYSVGLSTGYLTIESDGPIEDVISIKHRLLKKPLLRESNPDWINSSDLHRFLKVKYGCSGNESDPINQSNVQNVKDYIDSVVESANTSFALDPLKIDVNKPVHIEKIYLFYDSDDNGSWSKKNDEKQSYILIYQK